MITEIDLEAEGVTVVSADVYTTTVTDGKLNVKYNNLVGNYENVQINGITEEIQANNVFTAKITNSGTSTANVRINIFANKVGNSEASNLSATQDGVPVRTDTTWGGSFFTVEAGKTIEAVVIYDTERTSTAVQFMIDSHMGDSTARSGDITISGCGLYKNADYVPPEEGRFAAVKNRVSFSGNNGFKVANGYANDDDMFNCVWNSANVAVADDGVMSMSVTKDGASARGYYGGEYRSEATYGYGYYEVCMKPAKCSGVVSSFFTYTNSPVWDEIDIEFLGKDTTKVQFNYYVNGVGGHEYLCDLGFDASADFHVYGFDWQEGSITWYVDGKAVYTATPEQGEAFPSHNQQIMMNVWNCTGHDDWTGPLAEDSLPATAQYKWVAYEANA